MNRKLTRWIDWTLTLALIFSIVPARADENQALDRSKKTALVFLNKEAPSEIQDQVLKDSNLKADPQFVEEEDDWFVANVPPDEARNYILEKYGNVARIERNAVFYPFSACDDGTATSLPAGKDTPLGIMKMGGPLVGSPPARKVWIIDSGVDVNTTRLTVDVANAALCIPMGSKCKTAKSDPDRVMDDLGHGTFIAGVIAGKDVGAGSIVGMLPGATVVPIKVSEKLNPTPNADSLIRAMKWLSTADADHMAAANGDVVNISFGMLVDWQNLIEEGTSAYTEFEIMLRQLADNGVKISVAAGNISDDALAETGGYVELLSPARLGGYRPSTGGGAIVTASGMNAADDKFWAGSFFGNGVRPDFAAPSVDIQSLWWNNKQNRCAGTSFSAAHISGALLQAEDIQLTDHRPSVDDVDGVNDRIATCKKNMVGSQCDVM